MQKYSVLMAVYRKDNPEYFAIALDSMIHQTVPPDEIVIVKDGPITEELQAVIDERKGGLVDIREVALEQNQGLG
ncbi:MAG: glycosyltransferase, partial [Schwartzia sp.]|nr:glycosyltransferase [Schwartzia sp. (in: firmicutes)]